MNNVASQPTESAHIPVQAEAPGQARYLVSDKKHRVRRSAPLMRIIGNLFIVAGLLTLVAIGGWFGYSEWTNQQDIKNIGPGAFEPAAAPKAVVATPVADLPVFSLSSAGSNANPIGNILGVANKPLAAVDNSPPVRLYLPSVGIDTKVVPVGWDMIPSPNGNGVKAEWQVADFAVGHHQGSSNPGQPGNVVLSGHVDYKGQVFKDLHNAHKGDEVIMYTEKGQYLYVITDMVIVKEVGVPDEQKRQNAAYMNPTQDPTLTMITCWPYGIDTHRLIVIAKPYQSTLSTQSEFTLR